MSIGFRALSSTDIEVEIDPDEAMFLRGLLAQLTELVESDEPGADGSHDADPLAAMVGIGTATHLPLDPVLARLFPDGYHDDAIAAGDFRRYTELRLRARKSEQAGVMTATLHRAAPIVLDAADTQSWLGALNDLRLVLGTLLEVAEDDDVHERLAEPGADTYQVYLWLTELQGALLEALAEGPE